MRNNGIDYNGNRIDYTRDAAGQVTAASLTAYYANPPQPPVSLLSNAAHLPFGPVNRLTYGNGLVLFRSYDQDYRLRINILNRGATVFQSRLYGYDPASNLQTLTDKLSAASSQSFAYDSLNRLTSAASTGTYGALTYIYDSAGNREREIRNGSTTLYGYDLASQKLLSLSGGTAKSYSHDAAGNVTQSGSLNFLYNGANQLAQVRQNGSPLARYIYDGLGRRSGKPNQLI